jgi:hypothetical protein
LVAGGGLRPILSQGAMDGPPVVWAVGRETKTTADPFRDDNQKGNGKAKAKCGGSSPSATLRVRMTIKREGSGNSNGGWVWAVYIRPIAKCAMDGAPVLLWLGDERQRQKQLPCGDDN